MAKITNAITTCDTSNSLFKPKYFNGVWQKYTNNTPMVIISIGITDNAILSLVANSTGIPTPNIKLPHSDEAIIDFLSIFYA